MGAPDLAGRAPAPRRSRRRARTIRRRDRRRLGADGDAYRRLFRPLVDAGQKLPEALLSPLDIPPRHPLVLARYGLVGHPEREEPHRTVRGRRGAGAAGGHGRSLDALARLPHHRRVRAVPRLARSPRRLADGARRFAARSRTALAKVITDAGGEIVCGHRSTISDSCRPSRATLLDLTPRQVVAVAGHRLPARYRRSLLRFRYGPGVFKVDWALDGPIPWTNEAGPRRRHRPRRRHVRRGRRVGGGDRRRPPPRPTVRPAGSAVAVRRHPRARRPHTAWGYCHVPYGSTPT